MISYGNKMNLSVQIGRLTLQNPVTVASGTFGYGVEYAQLLDLNQLGAVTVKGIRLESRAWQPDAAHRRSHQRPAQRHRPARSGRGRLHQEILAVPQHADSADNHQHLGHDRRGIRRGRAPLRRAWWRGCAGTQCLVPQHQGRRRAIRHRLQAAQPGGGCLPEGHHACR